MESWQALRDGNLLLEWALNLMVLNVSTRKYHRAVRLPEGDLAKARGDGTSKSAVSRRFVALSRKKMKAWCQRRTKISPPGRSKTSPLNVMRYAVLGGSCGPTGSTICTGG